MASALEARHHLVTRVLAGPGLDVSLRHAGVEVVFNALHGRMGEDGRVQGLLEVLGVPYTGSGVLASALAMNKVFAKQVFRQHNLATPVGYVVRVGEVESVEALHCDLGFPCVVKPVSGGSSVGVSHVASLQELESAVELACRFGGAAVVERFVPGREVTVAVLDGQVLGSCEVSMPSATFDFATKYEGGARYHLPPRLSPTRLSNVEAMALRAYRALGCRGPARADFRCSEVNNDVLLEVNTQPGLTPMSLFPRIARHRGLHFEDLIERILDLAALDGIGATPRDPPEESQPLEAPGLLAG